MQWALPRCSYADSVENRRGLGMGIAAYLLWGAFPLYWPLLAPAGAVEILSHRIVWSALIMTVLVLALKRTTQLRALLHDRRRMALLTVAAAVISVNWGTYIWGVNHDRVVEASLGYFINPLVTLLLGVLVLGERLRPVQWGAVGVGALAVLVLTVDYGHPPWVALILACSFGTYGLAKKKAATGAIESLAFETAISTPVALIYLVVLSSTGAATFSNHGAGHMLLFMLSGVITAVPLILFGGAAIRVSMVQLGLLQYIAPILQFGLGVFLFQEAMTVGRWFGFALVWVALAIFTVEAARNHRRQLAFTAEASAL